MNDALRTAFREDGAVLIKGLLNQEQLARCRAAFDWALANHGPHATRMFNGTEQQSHVDNANPLAKERLEELVASLPFGQLFADLWGSKNVWYFAEEVFLKAGGHGSRTLWHQDTSYLPWAGNHWVMPGSASSPFPGKMHWRSFAALIAAHATTAPRS
ncbi:hypothetical protein D9M70_341140 [compost metagenome]